jgi:hypothetical protein
MVEEEVVVVVDLDLIKSGSRESVLFIGTQFSNLYTAVDTPAKAAWLCVWCLCVWCLCVSMCSDVLGSLSL